jgi:micrococcal nuclease
LLGIDSPEMMLNNRTYESALQSGATPEKIIAQGKRAVEYVKQVLHFGSQVWLEFDARKRDRHGRLLAYVFLPGGAILNERVLEEGYARLMPIPPNLKYQIRLAGAFRLAQANRRGFWAMNGNR